MSLISDALKKARQEAARQDSLRQGVPYAVGSVEPPSRRSLLPVLAGLGAGCLVAGLLFAVAWGAGWGPFAHPEAAPASQVAQAVPQPPAPAAAAPATPPQPVEVREETPSPKPVQTQPATPPPPAAETRPVPEPTPQAAPPQVEPAAPQPAPPSIVLQPSAPVEEPRPAPTPAPAPESSGGLEEGKVYAGEVPVPGGGSIKLNGIAFSPEHPIVVLDGRVMGPGETVQGFTIVEIQSDRVKLQGHGTTVFVTTK